MSKRYLTWEEVFDLTGNNSLSDAMITILMANFTEIDSETMAYIDNYIYMNNKGVSFFPRKLDDEKIKSLYENTFAMFIMSNKMRIKFALSTAIDGLNKKREYTHRETGDSDNNVETTKGSVVSERSATATDKTGFYTTGLSVDYISDSPTKENSSVFNNRTDNDNSKSRSIDITKTESENITDPYSYVHINDFVNHFAPVYSIIQEYYKEYTVPIR